MKIETISNGNPEQDFDYVRFDTDDCWNMTGSLAGILLGAIECLRRYKQGVPGRFFPRYACYEASAAGQMSFPFIDEMDSAAEDEDLHLAAARWDAVLDTMVWSFRALRDHEYPSHEPVIVEEREGPVTMDSDAFNARVRDGLDNFAKHYQSLYN
jgi:hypothetical protein